MQVAHGRPYLERQLCTLISAKADIYPFINSCQMKVCHLEVLSKIKVTNIGGNAVQQEL